MNIRGDSSGSFQFFSGLEALRQADGEPSLVHQISLFCYDSLLMSQLVTTDLKDAIFLLKMHAVTGAHDGT